MQLNWSLSLHKYMYFRYAALCLFLCAKWGPGNKPNMTQYAVTYVFLPPQEWRHAHGMRCLGIPNTAHFASVTNIADALACRLMCVQLLVAYL